MVRRDSEACSTRLADDHGGAAGDGWTRVGNNARVGLSDEDFVVGDVEGLSADLRQDGVGALAEDSVEETRRLGTTFGREFDLFDEGVEAALAGSR